VEELFVEAGNKVKTGDVIARIRIIPDLVNLNNAEARVERAKIALDDAKINFDRKEKLFKQGVIAEIEFHQPAEFA